MQWLWPTPANVEALHQFPFLDSNDLINDLVPELSNYLATAQDVIMPCEEDKVKCWRQQSDNLPHWSSAIMKVLLVKPSSAAAEKYSLFLTHRSTIYQSMLSWTTYMLV